RKSQFDPSDPKNIGQEKPEIEQRSSGFLRRPRDSIDIGEKIVNIPEFMVFSSEPKTRPDGKPRRIAAKLWYPVLLASLASGWMGAGPSRAADPDAFEVFSYDLRTDGTIELPGRLYVPENQAGGDPRPIVLYLH